MVKRIVKSARSAVAVIVWLLASAVSAQPTERPFIQGTTDIPKEMAPCTELGVAVGGEASLPRSAVESCAGQCEKVTANAVTSVRQYFRTSLWSRAACAATVAVLGGLGLWWLVRASERRRRISGRDVLLILSAGMVVIALVAMGVPIAIEHSAAERFVAADHDLRELARLGLIGRSSLTTNAHCTTQMSLLLRYSDSPVWPQLGTYPGLFESFRTNVPLLPGDPNTEEELRVRLADMRRVLDEFLIPSRPLPTSPSGVLSSNEMLRKAEEAWDLYGVLRWRLVGGVAAAVLALLIHYLCRAIHDAIAAARVRQLMAGAVTPH